MAVAIRSDSRTRRLAAAFAAAVRRRCALEREEIFTLPRTVTLTTSLAVTQSPMWPSRIESRRNRSLMIGRVLSCG